MYASYSFYEEATFVGVNTYPADTTAVITSAGLTDAEVTTLNLPVEGEEFYFK